MNPADHEKKRLPRAVPLEKRNYIGFSRQPVIDRSKVFVNDESKAVNRYHVAVYPSWDDT